MKVSEMMSFADEIDLQLKVRVADGIVIRWSAGFGSCCTLLIVVKIGDTPGQDYRGFQYLSVIYHACFSSPFILRLSQ